MAHPRERSQVMSRSNPRQPRVSFACRVCRMRKCRCDGKKPVCSACHQLGLDCLYPSSNTVNSAYDPGLYFARLAERLERSETISRQHGELLADLPKSCIDMLRSDSDHVVAVRLSAGNADSEKHEPLTTAVLEDSHNKRDATDGMAITFIDDQASVYFGASSNIVFTRYLIRTFFVLYGAQDLRHLAPSVHISHASRTASSSISVADRASPLLLPPVPDMDRMLGIYFGTTGALFPFLYEPGFMKSYQARREDGFAQCPRPWLELLNMTFAIACTTDPSSTLRREDAQVFYDRADELRGRRPGSYIGLDAIHCSILRILYLQGTQDSALLWCNHGEVVKAALAIGLHSEEAMQTLGPIEQESRRRTWLTCFILDRILSTTFGRPPMIPQSYVTVDLPSMWIPAEDRIEPNLRHKLARQSRFFRLSTQLYLILGDCLVRQYGDNVHGVELHDNDLLTAMTAVNLRQELEQWRGSLPVELALVDGSTSSTTGTCSLRIALTMGYLNLMIYIHRPLLCATLRYMVSLEGNIAERPPYTIGAAMEEAERCVAAAVQTVKVVHALLAHGERVGPWWFTLHYGTKQTAMSDRDLAEVIAVYTSALILISRTLWALNCGETAGRHSAQSCQGHLEMAASALDFLNSVDPLISRCAGYIRHLLSQTYECAALSNTADGQVSLLYSMV